MAFLAWLWIFFSNNAIQGRLGTRFFARSKKSVYVSTSTIECRRIHLALSLTWIWRHVWETCEGHWRFNRGRWEGGIGRTMVNSKGSYFFFLFCFLGIMLTQHIKGQDFLVLDIFISIVTETYIMAGYLCKVVLESINVSTTFRFAKFT